MFWVTFPYASKFVAMDGQKKPCLSKVVNADIEALLLPSHILGVFMLPNKRIVGSRENGWRF